MAFKTLHTPAQTYSAVSFSSPCPAHTEVLSSGSPCGYLWSETTWLDLAAIVSPRPWGQECYLVCLSPGMKEKPKVFK